MARGRFSALTEAFFIRKGRRTLPKSSGSINSIFELCCVRKFNLFIIVSKYLITLKNVEDILGLTLLTIQPGVHALYKHRQHILLISMQV